MKKRSGFPVLYPNAAGIDIASKEHWVAVNPDVDTQPIRPFGAFTEDLFKLAQWLLDCRVDTVAMEATGIYWVSLYLILEEIGLKVFLVNARHVKNVSGKKSDVKDAEWIRQLHSCGLLNASFQPDVKIRKLRTYMRHRKNLTEMSATHIRMMQKAMEQMNIKLQHVITDITGKSGQAIISAILNGERDPDVLTNLLKGRIKASKESVAKSLNGIWKDEHLFELRQSFDCYHYYRVKINECDEEIKKLLSELECLELILNENGEPIPTKQKAKSNKNNLSFDATQLLNEITGVDLTKIPGITDSNAVEIISEVGLNMSKWPNAKNFTSWLNLAPNNKISGGKTLSTKTTKKKNRAGLLFRLAANAVQRSDHWLAAFFHRIKSRAGTGKAITATARKIAVIFYNMLKVKQEYSPIPIQEYNQLFKVRQLQRITAQAKKMGFGLVEI
jgi:transposase